MGKYVYRPYHSWRHGYRREKIHNRVIGCLKLLLAVELLILAGRYIEEHTSSYEYKREQSAWYESGEEIYGIGLDAEKGKMFWFHKKSEMTEESEE